jgi:hypothetical protein
MYIVISESRHSGWVANHITLEEAQDLLRDQDEVVYIFRIPNGLKNIMLLPIEFYDCLKINTIPIDTNGDGVSVYDLDTPNPGITFLN